MRYANRFTLAMVLIGILTLMCGCSQPPEEIEILCGNSFRDPMEELARQYEKQTGRHVEMSFGGSEQLLPQVELKAVGDVFVTHDPFMDKTKKTNALLRAVQVGFQAPVLVVRKGNPKKVESFEDLARPGLRVVLPDPEDSTCGQMVFKLLEEKQMKDAVLKNVGNRLVRHHASVANQLKLEVCDAGIMWNGVAHTFRDSLQVVKTPYEYDKETRVYVIGLNYTEQPEALEQFMEFARGKGPEVFAEFGYVK